jgi:M6 family metalloprotease-like protein
VLVDALDKLTARDGTDSIKDLDAIIFVYAGDRYRTNAGAVYYPHAGTVNYKQKRIPYLVGPEGGPKLTPIGGFVKQLGQLLGLPDLAARPENAGSKGLGVWCAMSNPFDTARPQDLSAWCKERLGWITPVPIDPTRPQKLVLSPIESAPKECLKVLVRPDGSEYYLLEVRAKKGFDADLPGEGLLVWRVLNDRPTLEESHGVEGPTGPTVHLGAVPYPSPANNSFTPDTIPSSRSPKGGGLPVYITDIRRPADGRIAFRVGYEFE